MRSFRAFLYFTLGVMIALTWGIRSAQAQGVVYNSPAGPIPTEVVGPFSSYQAGLKGGASTATASGVSLRASGVATTTLSNGARIGTTIAIDGVVQRSKIAAAAAAFARWGRLTNPAILAGSAAYAVYQESGYQTCPPPDFFCKPGTAGAPATEMYWQMDRDPTIQKPTPGEACLAYSLKTRGDNALRFATVSSTANYLATCAGSPGYPSDIYVSRKGTCPATYTYDIPTGSCSGPAAPAGPYTDAELEKAMADKMAADPAFHKKYWDAVISDADRNANFQNPTGALVPADTPITPQPITPTTTPPQQVAKETIQNADGTTSTRTTTAQTTVQPKVEGTTAGDARVTASSTTTYTTTTINNTTNATTTNTNTVTNNTTEQKRDDSFVDSGMPDVPSLYTQKYPDGLAGAWRDHKPDVSSTGFFAGVKGMFPEFGGGSCPSFALPLTIGSLLGAGTVPFNVPCSIYGFIGLVMLITAAFTARKIIF